MMGRHGRIKIDTRREHGNASIWWRECKESAGRPLQIRTQQSCGVWSYFVCDTKQPYPHLPAQAHFLPSALDILPGQLLAHSDLMLMGRGSRKWEMDVDWGGTDGRSSLTRDKNKEAGSWGKTRDVAGWGWKGSPTSFFALHQLRSVQGQLHVEENVNRCFFLTETWCQRVCGWGLHIQQWTLVLKMFHCPKRKCLRSREPP